MALPGWLDPLPSAQEMRDTDRWAIEEQGIPSLDLMERAGQGLADAADVAARAQGPVVVVCGKGNNGGGGPVGGRLLRGVGRGGGGRPVARPRGPPGGGGAEPPQ